MGASGQPRFAADSAFWRDLRREAAAYFAHPQTPPMVGDARLRLKAAVALIWFALSYAALLAAGSSFGQALTAAASLALASGAVGLGIWHDANHGSFSRRASVNLWMARLISILLGPSRYFWRLKHQHFHHRAPNLSGWDDDIDARGWLRLAPSIAWSPRYRGQQWLAPFFYAFNTLEWFFVKDFACLWQGQLNRWQAADPGPADIREFWIAKSLWFLCIVLPPFLLLPFATALAALLLYHLLFSLVLTFVFQLAHLTPAMAFNPIRADDDWAGYQMRTTANFATGSRLTTWYVGGLNHQVEHHLFPQASHSHYPALAPIVRGAAQRHGLPYHDLGSLPHAVGLHLRHLRTMGMAPQDQGDLG